MSRQYIRRWFMNEARTFIPEEKKSWVNVRVRGVSGWSMFLMETKLKYFVFDLCEIFKSTLGTCSWTKRIVFQFLKKIWKGIQMSTKSALIPIHIHLPKLLPRHLFNKSHRLRFQFSFYSSNLGKSINLSSNYITISHVQTLLMGCITVPRLAFTSFFIASYHVSEM